MGVMVVVVLHLGVFAKERIGLVKKEDRTTLLRRIEDLTRDHTIIHDDEGESGLAIGERKGAGVEFIVDVLRDDRTHVAVDVRAEWWGDVDGGGAGFEVRRGGA